MESFAIGMLLGAAFVCIAAFFIGMLGGDVDISDIMHDNMKGYIKGSETDELYKMERLIVHEIVKRERSEITRVYCDTDIANVLAAKKHLNNVYGQMARNNTDES